MAGGIGGLDRGRLLEALRDGMGLEGACGAAGGSVEGLAALCAADDDWACEVEGACAEGGSKRQAQGEPRPAAPASEDRHAAFVAECAKFAPGLYGALLWVESRCVAAGMHALDPQWLWHFREFYESGKMVDAGRFGLRAAKSVSVPRALVAEILYTDRRLEPGQVGVCPIMSVDKAEAADRFSTVRRILSACGLTDHTGKRTEEADGFVCAGGGSAALKITMQDLQGHDVEIRVYPASISGASGFTAIAGFLDELDLWGKEGAANPADRVIEIVVTRFTTQPGARLHVMSATYHPTSAHAKMIAAGDTALQRVARLGAAGAAKDETDRRRLAAKIGSSDARLLAPGDPNSTDVPSWVSNPTAPIETCHALSKENIDRMFALYGGRVTALGIGMAATWTVDEIRAIDEHNRSVARPAGGVATLDGERAFGATGLRTFPGLSSFDQRSENYRGPMGGGGGRTL